MAASYGGSTVLQMPPEGAGRVSCAGGAARVRPGIVRQTRQIVHAGFQSHGEASALLKGRMPRATLQLGVVALINAGQKLHFDLCIAHRLAKLPQS